MTINLLLQCVSNSFNGYSTKIAQYVTGRLVMLIWNTYQRINNAQCLSYRYAVFRYLYYHSRVRGCNYMLSENSLALHWGRWKRGNLSMSSSFLQIPWYQIDVTPSETVPVLSWYYIRYCEMIENSNVFNPLCAGAKLLCFNISNILVADPLPLYVARTHDIINVD